MHCTNCGAELSEGSAFCTNCGTRIPEPEAQPAPVEAVEAPVAAPVAEPVAEPAPARKSIDVKALTAKLPDVKGLAAKLPNLKEIDWKHLDWKKLALPIGIAVAAIVVIILLISLISGGGTTPIDGLTNLVNEGNFAMKVTIDGEKVVLNVKLDVEKQTLEAYGEVDDMEIGIYDGQLITYYTDYEDGYTRDISDEIEVICEAFGHYEKGDWDEFFDLLDDLGVEIAGTIDDTMDMKVFSKSMDTLMDKLENKSWLKETAKYETESKDGVKTHIYDPDLYKFGTAVLEIFEKAFDDDDDYDDALEYLKDNKNSLKKTNLKVELGVKGKYLVDVNIKAGDSKYKVSFSDIGDTKVDTDRLEEILEELE